MVQFNFNATQYDPSVGGGDVWDTGRYKVQIVQSAFQPTKNKDGHFLALTYAAIEGPLTGRRIVDRLNLDNPNSVAVDIANRTLSAISYSVGRLQWNDTQELHGIPFTIDVVKEERNNKPGSFSNNITAYMDANGGVPTAGGGTQAPQAAPQPAPAPAPAPASAQPWAQPAPQQQPQQPWTQAQPENATQQPWAQADPAPAQQPSNVAPWQR